MAVSFHLLGPLEVLVDGVDVTPAAPKERGLLALLALSNRRIVRADHLTDELWPTLDTQRARHVLQVRVAEVRKLLRDGDGGRSSRLAFVAPGYRLELAPDEIDAHRFVCLVAQARARSQDGDAAGAAAALREAIGLWRGEPLGGVAMTPDLEAEAARLADARVAALEACVEAELACGCHEALTFELEQLVAEHPLRERLWAQRAVALYRCGRQADALRACQAIRRRLADEVGVEPGPTLRDIERAVLEQRAELDWSAPPGRRAPATLGQTDLPPVQYARAPDGASIAYQVEGDGPVDLIVIPGFTSHLDIWWAPWSGRLARRLATFSRLIVFDKRGMGLSDRPPELDIEHWVEDTRVVLDAVGSERAVVLGMSAGGTVGVLFAATYPERTKALILYGAEPRYVVAEDYPYGLEACDVEPAVRRIQDRWGTGVLFSSFCPSVDNDPELREHYARFQRDSASPGAAATYLRSVLQTDVRHALPLVSAPTLVLHATRDVTDPIGGARYMAARIPDAKLVELDSADHLIWLSDALDTILDEIRDFVEQAVPSDPDGRVLATVLAVEAPAGIHGGVERLVERFRGNLVHSDGELLARFDGPARAIQCATAIVAELSSHGEVRAGLHCGECEVVDQQVRGVTVQIARGVARLAAPEEIVVSQTVRDLVFGSDITLREHGRHALDGVDGRWSAYVVTGA